MRSKGELSLPREGKFSPPARQPMPERFKNHINKFAPISDAEFAAIREYVEIRTFRKKENLLTEGQICRSHFFVLQGLLRQFFINEKGQEQTTEFAIENWWITDQLAFESQTASGFSIQAVEKSEVLIIHRDAQEALFQAHPIMERYFRFIYQRAFAAAQRRVQYIFPSRKKNSTLVCWTNTRTSFSGYRNTSLRHF